MFSIIEKQQKNPVSLDSELVTSIPVRECGDTLVDVNAIKNEFVRMLPVPDCPMQDLDHNAGLSHSSHMRTQLFLRLEAAAKNFNLLYNRNPKNSQDRIVFMVFEGLRSLTDSINTSVFTPNQLLNNAKSSGGFVSFRVFNDTTNEFLDMGEMQSEDVSRTYMTFSKHLTHEQQKNRTMLLEACAIAGMVNYPLEWWTFCFGTQYYAYYTDNKFAIYGPIANVAS